MAFLGGGTRGLQPLSVEVFRVNRKIADLHNRGGMMVFVATVAWLCFPQVVASGLNPKPAGYSQRAVS